METKVIREKQDLTYLKWSHIRSSSGTAGTFLKSESVIGQTKRYYKLSNFDSAVGVVGHECVNEIIVDRLLTILNVEHLHYELIYADIEVDQKIYTTYLCSSEDFKKSGESKIALDDYYRVNNENGENHYDFCKRLGWQEYIDTMLAVDFLILNRDRHGANIEVLRNSRNHTLRIAPLFDHGLSLIYSCNSENEAKNYDIFRDMPCQNFIGSRSCKENLKLIKDKKYVFKNHLEREDKEIIFKDLSGILPDIYFEKIWDMIYKRYKYYESL